jgi:hypothetical protein
VLLEAHAAEAVQLVEHQVPVAELARGRREVQDGGVVARRDDSRVGLDNA